MTACAVECGCMVATVENSTDCGAHLAEARVFACPYRNNDQARKLCIDFKVAEKKKAAKGTSAKRGRRERPADGGIVWHEEWNAFECYGCGEYTEIRDRHKRTPDKLAEMQEFLIIDHTECWEFDDPKMAADARKYRSEKKRRENLKARASGALDRQSVSWRGRQ